MFRSDLCNKNIRLIFFQALTYRYFVCKIHFITCIVNNRAELKIEQKIKYIR